jgi:hypothetical protein
MNLGHSKTRRGSKPAGNQDIRFSFAQWYGKAEGPTAARSYHDPSMKRNGPTPKLGFDHSSFGLNLHACCQDFWPNPRHQPSSCIDGSSLPPFTRPARPLP